MAKKNKDKKDKDKKDKDKNILLKTIESTKPTKVISKKNTTKPITQKKILKQPKVNSKSQLNSKTRLTNALKEVDTVLSKLKDPTLIVISNGIGVDGRVKFEMKWNDLFIKNVNKHGISGATEEETAMLFIVGCQLKPEEFPAHDEEVVSDSHPLLTAESNLLKR